MRPTIFSALVVAWALVCATPDYAGADAGPSLKTAPAANLQPISDGAWDYHKARQLLFRAGFGGPPEEVAKVHAMGLGKAVAHLVDFRCQPDVELALNIVPPEVPNRQELQKLTPAERQQAAQNQRRKDQQQLQSLRSWWIQRMVESPRPLEEKLVLFWHGHFATEYRTVNNSYAMYQQNQLLRDNAAGNFGKLLRAIVHDPAMLRYLDNNRNVKGRPNENLAREILELFSMGEGSGYTEQDIKEAARALTGYTFDRDTGKFRFAVGAHDSAQKTIFGKTANFDGDQLVSLILQQPATARFIARKLFIYFVHDCPDGQTVDGLAQVLRDNDYELAPLLHVLFRSQEFYSKRAMGSQIKCPVQLVVGTMRILQVPQPDPTIIASATRAMGQELFEPPNVKGWEGGRAWINTNTIFTRDNFAVRFITQGADGQRAQGGALRKGQDDTKRTAKAEGKASAAVASTRGIDLVRIMQSKKLTTSGAVVDYFVNALFPVELSQTQKSELIQFLGSLPPAAEWSDRHQQVNYKLGALLVLMMSMPEYQLT